MCFAEANRQSSNFNIRKRGTRYEYRCYYSTLVLLYQYKVQVWYCMRKLRVLDKTHRKMASHHCLTTKPTGSGLAESFNYGSRSEEKVDIPSSSCVIPQADSVVETCLKQIQSRSAHKESRRVILRGPGKSGKSCLAMDLALSLALSEPCRCNNVGRDLLSFSSAKQEAACRNCTAVTLIVPGVENRPFPISCESISDGNYYPGGNSTPDSPSFCESSRSKKAFVKSDSELCSAMKRIQIQHVSSLKDIFRYLLTITSLPLEDQPLGGIIIDDVDYFCSKNDYVRSTIEMSQIGTFIAPFSAKS
jgi:hypothetical protein